MRQLRLVAARRPRQYPARKDAFQVTKKGKWQWVDDPGGEGWEIARERAVCPRCVRRD
ncbi:MAG: hypothetical protein SFW67_15725 [Myxococcaceae bacterium]|nr:hypothetical protein [Myxococcaceae bacterium]